MNVELIDEDPIPDLMGGMQLVLAVVRTLGIIGFPVGYSVARKRAAIRCALFERSVIELTGGLGMAHHAQWTRRVGCHGDVCAFVRRRERGFVFAGTIGTRRQTRGMWKVGRRGGKRSWRSRNRSAFS